MNPLWIVIVSLISLVVALIAAMLKASLGGVCRKLRG